MPTEPRFADDGQCFAINAQTVYAFTENPPPDWDGQVPDLPPSALDLVLPDAEAARLHAHRDNRIHQADEERIALFGDEREMLVSLVHARHRVIAAQDLMRAAMATDNMKAFDRAGEEFDAAIDELRACELPVSVPTRKDGW